MIGADDGVSDVVFAISFTIGGVALVTLIGLWIRYRRKNGKD